MFIIIIKSICGINELNRIPDIIHANKNKISSCATERATLKSQLKAVKSEIRHVDSHIARRQRQVDRERERERERHTGKESDWHNIADGLKILVGDSELNALERERSGYASKRDALKNHISELNNQIENAEEVINKQVKRQRELNVSISNASEFLNSLHHNPEALCRKLTKDILLEIEAYEDENPANQILVTRLNLASIADKVAAIMEDRESAQVEGISEQNKMWQLRFAKLCGFLWMMFDAVNGHDQRLANRLISVLRNMHVNKENDLPDNAQTGQSVHGQFQTFKNQPKHYALYNLTSENFLIAEKNNYYAALQNLNATVVNPKCDDDLGSKASRIAIAMHREIKRPLTADTPEPDYKFGTRLLKETNALVLQPHNIKTQAAYVQLANHAEGKPSFWKKVGGVMLALLGTAMVTASVVAAIATFGASAPLSAITGYLGTSLIATGIAAASVGISASITLGGIGLFSSGMRKGISKQILELTSSDRQRVESEPVEVDSKTASMFRPA